MTQWEGEPVTAEGWIATGEAALRAGDKSRAHQCFRRATELAPEQVEAWICRAGSSDDPYEMLACLHRVLLLDPTDTRARQGIELVYLIYPQLKSQSPAVISPISDTTPTQAESLSDQADAIHEQNGEPDDDKEIHTSLASLLAIPEANAPSAQTEQPAVAPLSEQDQDGSPANVMESLSSLLPVPQEHGLAVSDEGNIETIEKAGSREQRQLEPNRITIEAEAPRRTFFPTLAGMLYLPVAGFWLLMAYRQAVDFFGDGSVNLGLLAAWNAAISLLFLVIARALIERSGWGLNWGIAAALLGLAGAAFDAAPAQSQIFPVPFYVGIAGLLGMSSEEFETRTAGSSRSLLQKWVMPALTYSLVAGLLAVLLATQYFRFQPERTQVTQTNLTTTNTPTITRNPTTAVLSSVATEIPPFADSDAREAIRVVSTFYPPLAGGTPATHTIDRFIQVMLAGARAQGDTIVSNGWRATPRGESSWLVSYSYRRNDEPVELQFLVNQQEARISGYNYAAIHFLDTTVDDLERTLASGER